MVKNWSDRIEELLDEGDSDGAARLLEGIVEEMRGAEGAATNLSLAAAMEDLGAVYDRQGFSLKADSLRSSAIAIRQRLNTSGNPCVRDEQGEDGDWESAAYDMPTSSTLSQLSLEENAVERRGKGGFSDSKNIGNARKDDEAIAPKQRGRGAFTYGSNGFSSDTVRTACEDSYEERTDDSDKPNAVYGASHVLVLEGLSPKTTTSDLEQLVMPFINRGVVIRWVNDTTALAVFRNPTIAREALATIRHPTYVLKTYDESSNVHGLVSEKELEPPTPRPATSARAAQRMIAGALASQGVVRRAQTKVRFTAQELQRQEEERRQRLLERERLREEAWGGD